MAANTSISVTELTFDGIRQNLRNFIATKPAFRDFDFADSAIGTLLDLLAYNTYYQAFYTNMAASESFIDTAQFYDSVVSRAKLMDYVPVSARGATANVRISFSTASPTAQNPTLTIAKNTRFTASINGVSYVFVTPETYTVSANSSNRFRQDVQLVEGLPLTHRFAFTTTNTAFVLPNENVDTRSISVTVTTSGNTQTYLKADDVLVVNSSALIYYVEADRDKKYKVLFGDGVLGFKPAYNSTVAVSYRVCNATKGNGANNFTAAATVGGQSNFTLTILQRAVGGAEQEDIESVRFNAPRAYETQNRAVVSNDYQRLILADNKDLQAVQVWGGEDNTPPVYGKVYVSVKPYESSLISSVRKTQIKTDLKKKNMQSIDVEIVDPTFLYIVPTISVSYDSRLSTLSASQVAAAVAARIITFETNNFNRFESRFWFSKFLTYLDAADASIVGTSAVIDVQKRFLPSTTVKNTYTFRYNLPLQGLPELASMNVGHTAATNPGFGWVSSSSFTSGGFTSYLDDDGLGSVRIYNLNASIGTFGRVYTKLAAGTIDYGVGTVVLNEFLPSAFSGSEIKINVRPKTPNIEAIRNQLLLFADAQVTVTEINNRSAAATLSTIATQGQSTTVHDSATSTITSY